jgi:hypothetical protein
MSFTNNQRLNGSAKPSGHQPSRTFRRSIPAFITGEPQAHSAPSGVLWLDTALRQPRLDARGRPATQNITTPPTLRSGEVDYYEALEQLPFQTNTSTPHSHTLLRQ